MEPEHLTLYLGSLPQDACDLEQVTYIPVKWEYFLSI